MKLIKQRHTTGCGIASLAMVAGISYAAACKLLHPKHVLRHKLSAIYEPDVVASLRKLGIKANAVKARTLTNGVPRIIQIKELTQPSILIIEVPKRYGKIEFENTTMHAVVWDPISKKILDPNPIPALKYDFYQKNLRWVILTEEFFKDKLTGCLFQVSDKA